MPGVQVLRTYQRSWLPRDLVPGLVLTALLVPAGMGYAEASGVPAIYGLYATVIPLVVYAIIGPSRILVLGPDSPLAPRIALVSFADTASCRGRSRSGAATGSTPTRSWSPSARPRRRRLLPGVLGQRQLLWDAPLFFANAEIFADHVVEAVASSPTPVRWVIVTAEPVTDLDTTAADVLRRLEDELAADGIDLRFAEMKDPVKDRLKRYGLLEHFGADHFYPTIGTAVDAYLNATGVEWTDWEDRTPTRPG